MRSYKHLLHQLLHFVCVFLIPTLCLTVCSFWRLPPVEENFSIIHVFLFFQIGFVFRWMTVISFEIGFFVCAVCLMYDHTHIESFRGYANWGCTKVILQLVLHVMNNKCLNSCSLICTPTMQLQFNFNSTPLQLQFNFNSTSIQL